MKTFNIVGVLQKIQLLGGFSKKNYRGSALKGWLGRFAYSMLANLKTSCVNVPINMKLDLFLSCFISPTQEFLPSRDLSF